MRIFLRTPKQIIIPEKLIGEANSFRVVSFTFVQLDGQPPYAEIGCQADYVERDGEGVETNVRPIQNTTVRVEGEKLAEFDDTIETVRALIYQYLQDTGHFPVADPINPNTQE